MVPGNAIDRHHWIPRAQGGSDWDWMHQICHRKIHALFDEATLACAYNDAEALRADPEMAKFISWVQRKAPAFNDWHKRPRRRR